MAPPLEDCLTGLTGSSTTIQEGMPIPGTTSNNQSETVSPAKSVLSEFANQQQDRASSINLNINGQVHEVEIPNSVKN